MKLKALVMTLLLGVSMNAQGVEGSDLPQVLIIGDSISLGYTKPLKEILNGKAIVTHNTGNAKHSGHGLENLDEWLGDTKWDVIHFNHGLHDLKYVDDDGKNTMSKETGHIQIDIEAYEKNMEKIVLRLKKTGAKLIFATTTPFPDRPEGPLREAGQAEKYNAAALRVMKKHEVPVNDLYSFVSPRLDELQKPNNVHFTADGSKALAKEVTKHILKAIGQQENALNEPAYLVIEPVICRSSEGEGPAVSRIEREAIESVYAQANIHIAWLQPRYLDSSEARDGTVDVNVVVEMGTDRGLWGSGLPRLSLIFVNAINGKKGPRGLGMTPGPICFVAMPEEQTDPEMEAFAAAHEIGHCLGLIHAVDDPEVPNDIPNIMGDGEFSERIGKTALMPAHVERVRGSALLLWPTRDR